MHVPVSSLYAGILAFLLIGLSIRVIRLRFKFGIGIGDGDKDELARAIRAQGNFIEYTPFALILMILAELSGAPFWLLHGAGLTLLLARASHALSISCSTGATFGRKIGVVGTFSVLATLGVAGILHYMHGAF